MSAFQGWSGGDRKPSLVVAKLQEKSYLYSRSVISQPALHRARRVSRRISED